MEGPPLSLLAGDCSATGGGACGGGRGGELASSSMKSSQRGATRCQPALPPQAPSLPTGPGFPHTALTREWTPL